MLPSRERGGNGPVWAAYKSLTPLTASSSPARGGLGAGSDRAQPGPGPRPLPRTTQPRGRLADRAEVGRTVHERDPPDRRTAAAAGLGLAAVDLQRTVEVAALPVDVDVERVEG